MIPSALRGETCVNVGKAEGLTFLHHADDLPSVDAEGNGIGNVAWPRGIRDDFCYNTFDV